MVRWRKILYEDQGYPDNYYDKGEFLRGLQRNVTVVHYTITEAITGAAYLMSQMNVVVLYVLLFELVQHTVISFDVLLTLTIGCSVFCFCCYFALDFDNFFVKETLLDHFQTLVLILSLGYGFTPVIRTLTTAVSTDSIYIMTWMLFLLSLVFHDYGMDAPIVSSAYSLNLALAGSICLVSRLDSDREAFCFLALALCGFSFWPTLRNRAAEKSSTIMAWLLTLILTPTSILGVWVISPPLAVLQMLLQFIILLVCPFMLIRMQTLKSTIHGPWDEAILIAKDN
uniref:Phosphatidylinositol N-acetylglucosaminyltransferase subunit C n=1 Tax=Panagrellus redivivus TaxID=6233 RepID=A0A7E4VXG0_PANRE